MDGEELSEQLDQDALGSKQEQAYPCRSADGGPYPFSNDHVVEKDGTA